MKKKLISKVYRVPIYFQRRSHQFKHFKKLSTGHVLGEQIFKRCANVPNFEALVESKRKREQL